MGGVSQLSIFDAKKAASVQRSGVFLANADQTRRAASSMPFLPRDVDSRVQKMHAEVVRAIAEIGRQLNTLGVFHCSSTQRANRTPAVEGPSVLSKQVLQSVAKCPSTLLSAPTCPEVSEASKDAASAQVAAAA